MTPDVSGENLAQLLKELADRIQTNHKSTAGIIQELRAAATNLEKRQGNNA